MKERARAAGRWLAVGDQSLLVNPITRIFLSIAGTIVFPVPGMFLAAVPLDVFFPVGVTLAVVGAAVGLVRGATVGAVFADDEVRIRNLWRSYRIPANRIERIADQRAGGMFNAPDPALVLGERRLRLPIHAAMLWGPALGGSNEADERRCELIRTWADRHQIPVKGSVAHRTNPPVRARRRLRRPVR